MRAIPDAASVATIYWLEKILGRKAGASTGTNLYGALQLACDMKRRGEQGSIVTLLCDSGERYLDTYYNPEWSKQHWRFKQIPAQAGNILRDRLFGLSAYSMQTIPPQKR